MARGLSPKQVLFCEYYVIDFNATKAATKAGYSAKTAYAIAAENLRKPQIKQFIEELQGKVHERLGITHDYVLGTLKEVVERCMQNAPVLNAKGEQVFIYDKNGKLVPAYTFNAKGAIAAAHLIGQEIKMFGKAGNIGDDDRMTSLNVTQNNLTVNINSDSIKSQLKKIRDEYRPNYIGG